jgi:hypothetical protein
MAIDRVGRNARSSCSRSGSSSRALASFRSAVPECRRQIADVARRPGVVREEDSEVSYVGLEGVVSQDTGLQPFVRLRRCDGRVYSAADQFLREVDSLREGNLFAA